MTLYDPQTPLLSRRIFLAGIPASYLLGCRPSAPQVDASVPLKVGYFIGGKTYVLYRALYFGAFAKAGSNLSLWSRYVAEEGPFRLVPNEPRKVKKMRKKLVGPHTQFGKVSGLEMTEGILSGELDGGTVGESSFIAAVTQGAPLVAVAMLQQDSPQFPAKAIALRRGLKIEKPEDFTGLTLASRRAGPGEEIFMMAFLDSLNIDWRNKLTLRTQVNDKQMELELGKSLDGGMYHITTIRRLHKDKRGYIYRLMDWIDPRLSHGLLVFHKDVIKRKKNAIQAMLKGYLAQIRWERSLSKEQRIPHATFPLRMIQEFQGMALPQIVDPPLVDLGLLQTVQSMLKNYGHITKEIDLHKHIDNHMMLELL